MIRAACFCRALVLALGLSGCGGGGGGGGGSSAPPGPGPGPGPTPQSGWSSSVLISILRDSSTFAMFTPAVALTSQGVGFVTWNEADASGSCGRIWVNRGAAGAWGAATRVDTRSQALDPHVAANAGGDAIAVWTEREWSGANCTGAITGNEVWASRYTAASSTWSAPLRISVDAPPDSTIFAFSAVVALDAAGHATVAWLQTTSGSPTTVTYSRFDGTLWSAPVSLSGGTRSAAEPTLAVDGGSNVFAVWRQDTNTASPNLANMWAARYDATTGAWSTPALIGSTNLTGTDFAERPRLAVNAGGDAVAAWQETRGAETSIVAARFSSGAWTTPVALENNVQQAAFPAVAIDINGNAQAVWIQKIDAGAANDSGFTARLDHATGMWSAPQLFEQASEEVSTPQIGLEDSGRALIAWNQAVSGTPPVHAVHFTTTGGFEATPANFSGTGLALAVNAGGTALLASDVSSFETTFFGISIHAAMFQP